MKESFEKLSNFWKDKNNFNKYAKITKIIENYSFFNASNQTFSLQDPNIVQNIKDSKEMIINHIKDDNSKHIFFIICFKNTLIYFEESTKSISILKDPSLNNSYLKIYFLSETEKILRRKKINLKNAQIDQDQNFSTEVSSFIKNALFTRKCQISEIDRVVNEAIRSSIGGYLIKQSYSKIDSTKKILDFSSKIDKNIVNKMWDIDEFIELRHLGSGCSFNARLFYNIERGELFTIRYPCNSNINEIERLIEREFNNYLVINYPFFPKFYGRLKNEKYLVVQFINGQTLKNIKNIKITCINDRISIILQIIMAINYLHKNDFIYRDLRPVNVMIDENKIVYLVDLDRVIKISDVSTESSHTTDFSGDYIAPEVNDNKTSFGSDVYSLGVMIYYIMTEHAISSNHNKEIKIEKMNKIYKKCIDPVIKNRPSISELMFEFYLLFYDNINDITDPKNKNNLSFILNDPDIKYFKNLSEFDLASIEKDIPKAIHYYKYASHQKIPRAKSILGLIYYLGKYVKKDITKAIKYLEYAAKNGDVQAQLQLGIIYDGIHDTENAKHYYYLAAEQKDKYAQYNIGLLYWYNKKFQNAIDCFMQAANQDHKKAQLCLGNIFYLGLHVAKDIDRAIEYYNRAALNNDNYISSKALNYIGIIYYDKNDLNKAIEYFERAKKQNEILAYHYLGIIYLKTNKLNKAIENFSYAAEKDFPDSQYQLGYIYYYYYKNLNFSIYYFLRAAHQNHSQSQYFCGILYLTFSDDKIKGIRFLEKSISNNEENHNANFALGFLYQKGLFFEKNIEKSIYFYKKASSFYNQYAKNNLGVVYKNENKIDYAIIYFKEAIKQKNDLFSMYNLANIYLYDDEFKNEIDQSIDLLIKSLNQNFLPAKLLLCIALVKKNNYEMDKIEQDLKEKLKNSGHLSIEICKMIKDLNLLNKSVFLKQYDELKNKDFSYTFLMDKIPSSDLIDQNKNSEKFDITQDFKDGFEK